VKFSDGGQIMLTLKSGSFELFDADGYPYNKSGQSISSNQNSSLSLDGSQEVPPVPKDTSSDKLPPIPGH